jgi:predicted MPP superfamily phosphohydrolase
MSSGAVLACGGAFLAVAVLLAIYALAVEPYRPRLRRLVVAVPAGWPRLSVLHVSDLHARADAPRLARAQAAFLRSLPAADLVCVTGDLCETAEDAPLAVALVGLLRGRLGTVAVLGNHEHGADMPGGGGASADHPLWRQVARLASRVLGPRRRSSGSAEAEAVARKLAAAGVPVLANRGVRIRVGGRTLWVGGVDSVWSGRARGGAALAGRRPGEPCLGLVHEPEGAPALVARGADLALAGHTHGGQVRFPLIGAPYTLRVDPRVPHAAGLQRLGRGWLHVSTGLGQATPLRFRCPPEATLIECRPAGAALATAPTNTTEFTRPVSFHASSFTWM